MRALADSLSVHFPQFVHEPYFEECFSEMVEERHAEESLSVTQMVLRTRPALLPKTLSNAKIMAEALDGVWAHLDKIVQNASRTLQPDPWICRSTYCASPPIGGKGDKNDSIVRSKLSRVIGLAI